MNNADFILEHMRELIGFSIHDNMYHIRHELLIGDEQLTINHAVNKERLEDDPEIIGVYRISSVGKLIHEIEKRELKFSDIRPLPDNYSHPGGIRISAK